MGRQASVTIYVLVMIAVVIAVDFLFFKDRLWPRLIANIGMVLVFLAFYMRFLRP